MIDCLIIDDESCGRENLKSTVIKHFPDLRILGLATGVLDAIDKIATLKPQLIFLDIEMNDGTGFDVIEKCSFTQFEVIFVTAYDNYGLHALRCSAIDYILKPIDLERLRTSIAKAVESISLKEENIRLRNLIQNRNLNDQSKRIALTFVDSIEFVEIKDIIHLQADGSYTQIFTAQQKHTVSGSLKEYVEMLEPYGFLRPHQAHLVNPHYIASFVKTDGGYLRLKDQTNIPVSRLKKTEIIYALKQMA